MGLPSLVMWEPTERSVVEMMSSRPPMLTTLLRLTEMLVLKFQFTLPVSRRASSLDVETAVADLGAAHVGRRRGRA